MPLDYYTTYISNLVTGGYKDSSRRRSPPPPSPAGVVQSSVQVRVLLSFLAVTRRSQEAASDMGHAGPGVYLAHSGPEIFRFGFLGCAALPWAASASSDVDAFSRAASFFSLPPTASASSVLAAAGVAAVVPAALEVPAVTSSSSLLVSVFFF